MPGIKKLFRVLITKVKRHAEEDVANLLNQDNPDDQVEVLPINANEEVPVGPELVDVLPAEAVVVELVDNAPFDDNRSINPFLMLHVIETVAKYLDLNTLKEARLINKDWYHTVTDCMRNEDKCKIAIATNQYKKFKKRFKKTLMIPSTTFSIGWDPLQENFADFLNKFGYDMKNLIIEQSVYHDNDIPVHYLMKLLGANTNLEELTLRHGISYTESSKKKCMKLATVNQTNNFSLNFPKNSKLKIFKQTKGFLNKGLPYPMFFTDFFRSTNALHSLDLSKCVSKTQTNDFPHPVISGILDSGVHKTIQFLTLQTVDSDILLKIIEIGMHLKGFKVWESKDVLQDEWYSFLTKHDSLESLDIIEFSRAIGSLEPVFILKLPELKCLKSLTISPSARLIIQFQYDLNLTCPVLTSLKLFAVPLRLFSSENINTQISSLDLQKTIADRSELYDIAEHFPWLNSLGIVINNNINVSEIWERFPNLESLDLKLKCKSKESEKEFRSTFEKYLNGEYEKFEEVDDPWQYGPWEILVRDTPSILYLQKLRSLRILFIDFDPNSSVWGRYVRKLDIGDTSWYVALVPLKALQDVELVNIKLTEKCRCQIIKDSGIRKIKLISSS